MFRIFQYDPETSAILVNVSAIQRHSQNEDITECVNEFFQNNFINFTRDLIKEPSDSSKVAKVMTASSLLHEMRHYADSILTPYGFYRLRIAFEFYFFYPWAIASEEVTRIPIPLASGNDPVNRELLGISDAQHKKLKTFTE